MIGLLFSAVEIAPNAWGSALLPSAALEVLRESGRHFRPGMMTGAGVPGRCFGNAAMLAIKDARYLYVEGFARQVGDTRWWHHAWVVERADPARSYELTWAEPGADYFGVVLTAKGPRFAPALGSRTADLIAGK